MPRRFYPAPMSPFRGLSPFTRYDEYAGELPSSVNRIEEDGSTIRTFEDGTVRNTEGV